ncbi:cell wall hydrolase [Fulvimarina sp. 2208YS6-2-32]|uniref:Cell wall hydrolase n=1 Tax=Fulvimarina uroteuthidis TaxID=3098149 RepID=A0ABU5I3F4_9HYPH|nr:cell wall hydrolase [Fulvimarina sp. 2208YS6-2-32]MDY8109921.1 cell wall hydrolase [Fulvimarina sp. 2208YS6-2-32]
MKTRSFINTAARAGLPVVAALLMSGCVRSDKPVVEEVLGSVDVKEQTCMARAMYFESNRSSEDGMLAVGTVVMNRVESASFPDDVCSVVAQNRQFAPGVMTREMTGGRELAMATAAKVLRGERHEGVRTARFFHTAGHSFSYPNMHYVAIAGGNSFYEKIGRDLRSHARLATQADVKAGRESFDFATLRQPAETAIEPTSAIALDSTKARGQSNPFMSLFGSGSQD